MGVWIEAADPNRIIRFSYDVGGSVVHSLAGRFSGLLAERFQLVKIPLNQKDQCG